MTTTSGNIISFSLWGDLPVYNVGAVQNAAHAREIYPGWSCRYYVADNVPSSTLSQLSRFDNAELVEMEQPGSYEAACWRFFALDDEDVGVVLFRDLDSRPSQRERAAVDEWLASGKNFHIMRDSPLQHAAINAGAWGARKKIPGGVQARLALYLKEHKQRDFGRAVDQNFLGDVIYPIIVSDALVHDGYFDGRPFPTQSDDGEFVGEKIWPDGSPDPIARAFVDDCRRRPPGSLGIAYLRYGNRLKKESGRLQEALVCFHQACSLEPGLIPAYINQGNLLSRLGRDMEAEQTYREALVRDPNSVEAHANLGAIQLKQGRLDKAEPLILKALELKPDYAPALENLGYLRTLRQRK